MRSAILCLLLSAVAISADIQSDLADVDAYFPMKEFIAIGKQYVATNPSYADGLRYVQKVSYEKLVNDFLQTKEGQKLIEYFNNRGIDGNSVFLFMTKKTTAMIEKWLEPIEEGEELKPVISGDIRADYRKAIAESGLLEAAQKKIESSPEFANLVAAFKDPQYFGIFYNAYNSKARIGHGQSVEARTFWNKIWNPIKGVTAGVWYWDNLPSKSVQ